MCQRSFQLLEFLRRAVQFYMNEISHGKHFREQRAHVLEMCENALGAFVSFPAENLVAVDTEAIEKILRLSGGFPWHTVAIAAAGSAPHAFSSP